uniref:Uncharacterized protein n=1 Tax=Candidatus Kentrum sp. SD TaxID=2126332 RepID=A0A450YW22_9GAMM|nr:MAG: hypothetical protein BECKSD772F_GA0070984_105611 [Candidatus Kentron sp. SD]VFK45732.1 MAG: hypothetical protein BECKSD772E_GA0070983_105911 [Candidatus Kentron sp. SD]
MLACASASREARQLAFYRYGSGAPTVTRILRAPPSQRRQHPITRLSLPDLIHGQYAELQPLPLRLPRHRALQPHGHAHIHPILRVPFPALDLNRRPPCRRRPVPSSPDKSNRLPDGGLPGSASDRAPPGRSWRGGRPSPGASGSRRRSG